jgi:transposase InsO family protein
VGEGGDEVSVARFVADQRTNYRVPVVVCCAILGLSVGWFYKWIKAPVTGQARRRRDLDAAVRSLFEASDRSYGSPRIHRDLVEAGWTVGENTVADSMRRQGLFGRKPKRRRGLTKQDRAGAKFPDLVRRDFTASAPNIKWCGDMTEIPTGEGKLYLLVTWNHAVVGLFVPRRHHELRGLVDCPGDLGGEVAGAGPARAGGRVVADLDRPGQGTADDRRVCAGPGGVPTAV